MFGRPLALMPPALLGLAALLALPAEIRAHRLVVRCKIFSDDKKVQVSARYQTIPRSTPAVEARVQVFDGQGRRLVAGETDADGLFAFSYQREEPLEVEVYQEGHLGKASVFGDRPGYEDWVELVRNVAIGAALLLALLALWISWRTARLVRTARPEPLTREPSVHPPATD
jgi:hypothetical protein